MNVTVCVDCGWGKRQHALHRKPSISWGRGVEVVSNSLHPSHRRGVALSCPHWLIWISGSWEFVLTAEGWGNGPFITLMEEYWLWCRSTIPVCNSNGLPEKSRMKSHRGLSRKRETPLPRLLAPCYLCRPVCACTFSAINMSRLRKWAQSHC